MKLSPGSKGYLGFGYWKDGKKTTLNVHSCVAKVFLGDRSEEGLQALHEDGNSLNNKKENLYWGTHDQNMKDMIRHGTSTKGEKHPSAKLKEADIYKIRELGSTGMSLREIAAVFGVHKSRISEILSGKSWAHVSDA